MTFTRLFDTERFEVLRRGCRCLEIDVWDGDESSSSSSDSESDDQASKTSGSRREGIKSKISGRFKSVKRKVRSPRNSPPTGKSVPSEKVAAEKPEPPPEDLSLPAPWTTMSTTMRAEPRVLHGYTLTKEVSFREVCHAIRDSAFETSDLPVIVSLEVHAGLEQQQIMVEIMRHAWKGLLVDLHDLDSKEIESLPSPDRLRKKILVKVKWAPPPDDENERGETNNPVEVVQTTSSADDEQTPEGRKRKKSSKILHALSQFGVFTQSYSFKHLEQPGRLEALHAIVLLTDF